MGWQDAPEVDVSPMEQAHQQLSLTTQERALYQRHLDNLNGPGKVTHDDGSISTLYQMSIGGGNGKTYNIPSVYDGKILAPDEAISRAKSIGLNTFPSYGSHEEAESRYEQMHQYMDKDVGLYRGQAAWMKAPEVTEPPSALSVAGNAAWKGLAGVADFPLNIAGAVGNALIPPALRPGAMKNPVNTAMTAAGIIRPENEPQTPGQRILDMAVQAGVGTAISPASSLGGLAKNVAMGATSGAAAGVTKEATGSDMAALAVGLAVPFAAHAVAGGFSKANEAIRNNSVKSATLRDAQEAGLKVIPSQVNPSATTNKLESIGGKAAVKQQVQAANTEVIDELARKAIGLPAGEPITKESIQKIRELAAKPYIEVNKLSQVPIQQPGVPSFPQYSQRNLLEELKQARHDATAHFNFYNRNADPSVLNQAKAFQAKAEGLEKQLEYVAKHVGRPELVEQLKAARQLYARTYDVERAMNFADGHVNPTVLGSLFRKGKPLTGELAVIGKFASAFPDAVRESARIQTAGVSGTEAGMAAVLAMGGATAAGGPAGLIAGGLPLLRSPARAALLSSGYQNRLLRNPPELNQAVLQSILAGRSIAEAR